MTKNASHSTLHIGYKDSIYYGW